MGKQVAVDGVLILSIKYVICVSGQKNKTECKKSELDPIWNEVGKMILYYSDNCKI